MSTWITGTYDPDTNLIFWGTGNPGPDLNGDVRPGAISGQDPTEEGNGTCPGMGGGHN
ncbi:MAG TPA: hypothetical protein VEU96_27325 [Bryobacteraceae bacterium]|nr:hypothetical protein [Bryobacteraceae bacterium]